MRKPTRLLRDAQDRYKLEVSLPGGRYQLSLDDRAVNVLKNELELSPRDTVPDAFVPFFVATGDAWFPRERDTDEIIRGLPEPQSLTAEERSVLLRYLTESRIPKRNEDRVRSVLERSQISDAVAPEDLQIQDLPSLPESLMESASDSTDQTTSKSRDSSETQPTTKSTRNSSKRSVRYRGSAKSARTLSLQAVCRR